MTTIRRFNQFVYATVDKLEMFHVKHFVFKHILVNWLAFNPHVVQWSIHNPLRSKMGSVVWSLHENILFKVTKQRGHLFRKTFHVKQIDLHFCGFLIWCSLQFFDMRPIWDKISHTKYHKQVLHKKMFHVKQFLCPCRLPDVVFNRLLWHTIHFGIKVSAINHECTTHGR